MSVPTDLDPPGERRARKSIPQDVVIAVAVRDKGRCRCRVGAACHGYAGKCGSTLNPNIDHIIPVVHGGSDDIGNLQVLCAACNLRKKDSLSPAAAALVGMRQRRQPAVRESPKRQLLAAPVPAQATLIPSSPGVDFLLIRPGGRVYVRPVTDLDDIITIGMHKGRLPYVCRNDDAFRVSPGGPFEPGYGNCGYCTPLASGRVIQRTWGLFTLRDPVYNDQGKLTAFKDKTEYFQGDAGEIHTIPKIVIACQSWSNFWATFNAAGYMTDTICGKDFSVERLDDDYIITPGRETPEHYPGTPSWRRYTSAMELKGLSVEAVLSSL